MLMLFWYLLLHPCTAAETTDAATVGATYKVEGQISSPDSFDAKGRRHSPSKVLLNYGEYIGFVRRDGSFVVSGVAPGSYIVEISNLEYSYEPVRVDITSKGKIRARRLNLLQSSSVSAVSYPLRLNALHPISYFRAREEWHLTDMLTNPMVLMMVVPLVLLVILPKLVNANDPVVKKEMAKSMTQMDVPDVSDMLASWFGGNPKKPKKAASNVKRR